MVDEKEKSKVVATKLFYLLIVAPLIVVLISAIVLMFSSYEGGNKQYGLIALQLVLMGMYNVPFLIVSSIGLSLGSRTKYASWVSILSSVIGILIMILWGFGSL